MSQFAQYSGTESTTAPSLATQGFSLKGRRGYRVIVSAANGQTISNSSGTGDVYLYSEALGRWMRSSSFDFTVSASGVQDFPTPDTEVAASTGRVFVKLTGVTFSGGVGTVTIEGSDQ
jgi:hypothetical protein